MIYRVGLVGVLVLIGLNSCSFAQQKKDEIRDLRESISDLKEDLRALGDKQQEMIEQLKSMNQLLRAAFNGEGSVHAPSTVAIRGEIFKGDVAALVAIVEYADFECGFCAQFMRDTYPQINSQYIKTGRVKYFYRDLPLHPHALAAARAALYAGEQNKFWEMQENLFANQSSLSEKDILGRVSAIGIDRSKFSECFSSDRHADTVHASTVEAEKMGITGTPTFLIGTVEANSDAMKVEKTFVGAPTYEIFKAEIDGLLASVKKQ